MELLSGGPTKANDVDESFEAKKEGQTEEEKKELSPPEGSFALIREEEQEIRDENKVSSEKKKLFLLSSLRFLPLFFRMKKKVEKRPTNFGQI